MWIDIHGIKDAEHLLANLRALSGRATDHLFVQDPAIYTPQEHELSDRRNVASGRKQVDGHGDLRIGIVSERADQGLHSIDATGDLSHRGVIDLTISSFECIL